MSSASATHLHLSEERGAAGMQIHLAVHDGLAKLLAQFEDAQHGLCNARHLRELKFCDEIRGQIWVDEMRVFLQQTYKTVLNAKKSGQTQLHETIKTPIHQKYDAILASTEQTLPPLLPKPVRKRGRIRKNKRKKRIRSFEKV